jgi:hypothetical protein
MSKYSETIPQRSDARRAAELAELLVLRQLLTDIWQRRASVNERGALEVYLDADLCARIKEALQP